MKVRMRNKDYMNQSDSNLIAQSLFRIANTLEKIEKHLGGEKPKQKVVMNCDQCNGTGYQVGPGHDGYKNPCFHCKGGQIIKTI